ncbi:hypothetical protein [Myceligenerans crystallogenes]|uniref:Dioxygenase n=1 Tax=Myceligenerans crystallogenes TaxID=316335 RepID=A0ABP4ZHP7_9MICO
MARDADKQLLESVATRRERLREAFLHGDLGSRRSTPDNVMRFVTSVVLGAVACAGVAGFSFVQEQIAGGNGPGAMTRPQPTSSQPSSSQAPTTAPAGSPAPASPQSPQSGRAQSPAPQTDTDGATAP